MSTLSILNNRQVLALLKTAILTKLHSMGGVSKIVSKKMLAVAANLRDGAPVSGPQLADVEYAEKYNNLGYHDEILSWTDDDRFPKLYMEEVLNGLPSSKLPIFNIMFKLQRVVTRTRQNAYEHIPMAFSAYGGFQRQRSGKDRNNANRKWNIVFNDPELETLSIANKIGEIEVLITNPDNQKAWAGTIAFEAALCDLISRKSGGGARYKAVVVFTNTREIKGIALKHGFVEKAYSNKEIGPHNRDPLPVDNRGSKKLMVYNNNLHQSGNAPREAGQALLNVINNGVNLSKLHETCNPPQSKAVWRKCT